MTQFTDAERIVATLDRFDPMREDICVGGAAITLALAEADIFDIHPLFDVDVLASERRMEELARTYASLELPSDLYKTQLRRPGQRLAERGAKSVGIDIYPLTKTRETTGIVQYTACSSMSDGVYSINHEMCASGERPTTLYMGERAVTLGTILEWIAIIGRDKDLNLVRTITPIAIDASLISRKEHDAIQREYSLSLKTKSLHPERYNARRPEPTIEQRSRYD